MRTKPRALPVAVAVILTLVAAVALPQAAATTSKPTLRLSSLCEDYPLVSGIEVRARGFAPYTVITETVQRAYDDGSSDSFSSQTTLGPDGGGYIARYRTNEILTYTVSLSWGDGQQLERTLRPGARRRSARPTASTAAGATSSTSTTSSGSRARGAA